jgi:hypothetical protein
MHQPTFDRRRAELKERRHEGWESLNWGREDVAEVQDGVEEGAIREVHGWEAWRIGEV